MSTIILILAGVLLVVIGPRKLLTIAFLLFAAAVEIRRRWNAAGKGKQL